MRHSVVYSLTFIVLTIYLPFETEALAPFLLALTPGAAVGGLVTGLIGTVLGSISVAVALGKLDLSYKFEDYEYDGYHKRSLDDVHDRLLAKKREVERVVDAAYEKDPSDCLEKLICNLQKRDKEGKAVEEEADIMRILKTNENHGFAYKKMMVAMYVGRSSDDCDFLYDSCPLKTPQMVDYVAKTAKSLVSEQ